MNITLPTLKLTKKQDYYIRQLHYFSIITLVLLLPYIGTWKHIKHLIIIIFFLMLFIKKSKIKELFTHTSIVILTIFITLTYISFLWSPAEDVFTNEYWREAYRFKYWFLLIPGIYFANLPENKIKKIFFFMALAPIGTAILYHLNILGITHIYPYGFGGENTLLAHYLMNNFFITFSGIYFYNQIFNSFIEKKYTYLIISIVLLIVFASSLIIDPIMSSRLTILILLIVIIITPLFYLKLSHSIIIISTFLIFSWLFIHNNNNMQKGINALTTAVKTGAYNSSWGHRLGFIVVGFDIFKEHPVFGRGISDLRARTEIYAQENPKYFIGDNARHFHNEHITILVQVGLVGYLIYLIFIFSFLKIPISDPSLNRLKFTYIIAYLLFEIGENYFYGPTTSIYMCLIFILIISYKQETINAINNKG